MGKRQHQKDKMYLTYTEWTTLYGGKKSGHTSKEEENFRRLPFDHCCLSLQPFQVPYCDLDGNIFDLEALIPFMKKYKSNPVTGKPIDFRSVIQLNLLRKSEGQFECPVLFKPFTKSSHIAAIATTGNDPNDLSKFNISRFHHVKNNLRVETEEEIADKSNPQARLKFVNPETKYTLEELNRDYKAPTIEINKAESTAKADKFNAAHYSTGAVAASFTSTAMIPRLVHEAAIMHDDEVRYQRVKKKGYVRLVTNLGMLNLELYCDTVPKTCENFMKHCENGYYNGTKFHRSIRNFMIQGGDPTNTGNGGKSIWGDKFQDEFRQNLSHTGRGVLSMANSGKNTNGSQFFITYRSCKHLDNKHTIFGRVVGGMESLLEMEKIEVDNKDRPVEDIILVKAQIFVNPYDEADEQLVKERQDELDKKKEEEMQKTKKINSTKELKVFKNGVGKYINPNVTKQAQKEENDVESSTKKKKTYNSFNFSNW
ncbi:hypothetical protein JTB14_031110 [Gonioctena quinquepunctata]|nr:hypothetical protein JTB14_031110 [Gonioctena quinquepunctata]